MINKQQLLDYTKGLFRAYPIFILVFCFCFYLLFNLPFCLYITIYLLIVIIIGDYLKKISKQIYTHYKTNSIPWIGIGPRPKNAKYCGEFISELNLSGKCSSYGMPSCHALFSTCFAVLLTYYIQNFHTQPRDQELYSTMLIWYITSMVCTSRVLLNNHTFCQITVGSFLGLLFGLIGIYSKKNLNV